MQQVGISVWNGRISPVFDTAGELLLITLDANRETGRRHERLTEADAHRRARRLFELGVNVLICGAISRSLALACAALKVRVVPWRAGPAEEALRAYVAGHLGDREWSMPGCGCRRHRSRAGRGSSRDAAGKDGGYGSPGVPDGEVG